MMKKVLVTFLCVLILNIIPFSVYAHPGRTSSDGGHWDYENGEYHYHHGYSAHDHYDKDGDGDVDCPYNFDDQTGINSGSNTSNNNSRTDSSYSIYSQTPALSISQNISADSESTENFRLSISNMFESLFYICLTFLIGGPIVFVVYCFAVFIVRIPCSWLWKLINRSLSDDDNYKRSMITANVILCVVLCVLFLSPVVELLINAPDMLAVIIIIIGILAFVGVCTLIRSFTRNDSLRSTIRTLERERSDLELQLESAKSKSLKLERQVDFLETHQAKKISEQECFNNKLLAGIKERNQQILELTNSEQMWKDRAEQAAQHEEMMQQSYDRKLTAKGASDAEFENIRSDIKKAMTERDALLHEIAYENSEVLRIRRLRCMAKEAPLDISFTKKGMPVYWKPDVHKPYGDYTVFVCSKSNIYHADRFCSGYMAREDHIFNVIGHCKPCKKCAKNFFDFTEAPDWYIGNDTSAEKFT